jgi:hypothetical protein
MRELFEAYKRPLYLAFGMLIGSQTVHAFMRPRTDVPLDPMVVIQEKEAKKKINITKQDDKNVA